MNKNKKENMEETDTVICLNIKTNQTALEVHAVIYVN